MILHDSILLVSRYLDISDIANCLLLNSQCYNLFIRILKKHKLSMINDAHESIQLCKKTLSIDMLSTICMDMLEKHTYILKMNHANITMYMIETLNEYIKKSKNNMFKDEMLSHRNNLVWLCPHQIDLYMFTISELRNILKSKRIKNTSRLDKKGLIFKIREKLL